MKYLIIDNNITITKMIHEVGLESNVACIETNEEAVKALNLILKHRPQLVFINIDTTSINISDFLREIHQHVKNRIAFIALSSSKAKAYNAYKYDFLDFLLKPLTELSIRKSIAKFQKKHPVKPIDTICLKSYKDYQYLNINNILYLKADNNTTDFYMVDGSIINAYKTLKVFENSLPQTFLRIHKSYIINRNSISRINYSKSICVVHNKHKIPFTKTFIDNVDLINDTLSNKTNISLN